MVKPRIVSGNRLIRLFFFLLIHVYTYVKLRENLVSNLSVEPLFMCLTLQEILVSCFYKCGSVKSIPG